MFELFFNSKRVVNSLWMMSEKIISLFGLVFVTSYVAKYIGPEDFGKLTYATTLFGIIRVFAMLGLDDVFFQKIGKNRVQGEKLILASGLVRDLIFFLISILFLLFVFFYTDHITLLFSVAACISVFFSTKDIFSIYFDAILKSKINTFCNVIGLLLSLTLRYFIVCFSLPVEFLCLPIVSVSFIPYLIRLCVFKKNRVSERNISKHMVRKYRRYVFLIGKQMLLYSLSVQIFIRTSQFFLGNKSSYDLGIYAIASNIGFGFYFVFSSIIVSFVSGIYESRVIKNKRYIYVKTLVIISLLFSLIFSLLVVFDVRIIDFLYGEKYRLSVEIIPVLSLACFFAGINTLNEKYIMSFSGYSYLKKKTMCLVLINVFLSYILIHYYGFIGAAYATLITEFLSMTIFSYFFNSNEIFKAQLHVFYILKGMKTGK
ncbi:oligosaccharide flippase family protein [Rosenbergiella australiborealis]|uniref:oligosaccharide flippase family protein n=1 Tax=Rosenbergiella australiborealis TaxID=1544696 RepID=UPI001F4E2843|nr:oligosaccharide flippase family protein [Rosenbergiella australiborealis]